MSEENRRDWTTTELAKAGNVDPSMLRQLIWASVLPAVKRGHTWLISDADAQTWLNRKRRRRKPVPQNEAGQAV